MRQAPIPRVTEAEVEFIERHLSMESKYLDFLITESECVEHAVLADRPLPEMTTKARNRSLEKQAEQPAAPSVPVQSQALLQGRAELRRLLARKANGHRKPSLRELIRATEDPAKTSLQILRRELVAKLQKLQAVHAGIQTILFSDLHRCRKVLSFLAVDVTSSDCYTAQGQVNQHLTNSMTKEF